MSLRLETLKQHNAGARASVPGELRHCVEELEAMATAVLQLSSKIEASTEKHLLLAGISALHGARHDFARALELIEPPKVAVDPSVRCE